MRISSPTRYKGRLGRVDYILNSVAYGLIARLLLAATPAPGSQTWLVATVLVMLGASQLSFGVRRLHDLGTPAVGVIWTILPLVEFFAIWKLLAWRLSGTWGFTVVEDTMLVWGLCGWMYLAIRRGDPADNRYGKAPAVTPTKERDTARIEQKIRFGSETDA